MANLALGLEADFREDLGATGAGLATTGLAGDFALVTLFLGVETTAGVGAGASDSSSSETFFLLRLALVAASCSSDSLGRFFSVFSFVERRLLVGGDGSAAASVLRLGGIFRILTSKHVRTE